MGWERKWSKGSYRLQWFESWMKITPAIRVDASAQVSVDYTFTREYVLWTFSTRYTFWAGAVLVWANLKLTVSVGVELNANGHKQVLGIKQVLDGRMDGVQYGRMVEMHHMENQPFLHQLELQSLHTLSVDWHSYYMTQVDLLLKL